MCAYTSKEPIVFNSLVVLVDRRGSSITLLMEGAWLRERLLQLRPRWPMLDELIPDLGGRVRTSSGELSFVSELQESNSILLVAGQLCKQAKST